MSKKFWLVIVVLSLALSSLACDWSDGIDKGDVAEVNQAVENIGARRLYTVMERVFEELSFTAPDRGGEAVVVDAAFVEKHLGDLSRSADLSRYVL
jgi:ATP-dependent protease HslVU (ClpYQ) ATPase subunit